MPETSPGSDLPIAREGPIAATELADDDSVEWLAETRTQLRETLESLRDGRSDRELLQDVAYARLLAKLETLPVIEQAKGILMAQSNCTADEAFAMLRAASQRSNVKVRDLAQEIVGRVSGAKHNRVPSQLSVDTSGDG